MDRARASNLFSLTVSSEQSTRADLRAKSRQLRLIYFYSSYLRRSTQTKEHFLLCHPGNSWTILIQTLLKEESIETLRATAWVRFRSLSCDCQLFVTTRCLYDFYPFSFPFWGNYKMDRIILNLLIFYAYYQTQLIFSRKGPRFHLSSAYVVWMFYFSAIAFAK